MMGHLAGELCLFRSKVVGMLLRLLRPQLRIVRAALGGLRRPSGLAQLRLQSLQLLVALPQVVCRLAGLLGRLHCLRAIRTHQW